MMNTTGLIRETEAAKLLGVTTRTLQNWRFRGVGPCYVKLGRAVRYKPQDIEDYIDQNRQESVLDPHLS